MGGYGRYGAYLVLLTSSVGELVGLLEKQYGVQIPGCEKFSVYDLVVFVSALQKSFLDMFNFFLVGDVRFNEEKKVFDVFIEQELVGCIDRNSFYGLVSLICDINCVKAKNHDLSKVKSKKALELLKKIEAKRPKNKKEGGGNDYGVIVLKVACYSGGSNMMNVWDLTVYQTYYLYYEQYGKMMNDILSTNYAFHGGDNFDAERWTQKVVLS